MCKFWSFNYTCKCVSTLRTFLHSLHALGLAATAYEMCNYLLLTLGMCMRKTWPGLQQSVGEFCLLHRKSQKQQVQTWKWLQIWKQSLRTFTWNYCAAFHKRLYFLRNDRILVQYEDAVVSYPGSNYYMRGCSGGTSYTPCTLCMRMSVSRVFWLVTPSGACPCICLVTVELPCVLQVLGLPCRGLWTQLDISVHEFVYIVPGWNIA